MYRLRRLPMGLVFLGTYCAYHLFYHFNELYAIFGRLTNNFGHGFGNMFFKLFLLLFTLGRGRGFTLRATIYVVFHDVFYYNTSCFFIGFNRFSGS